MPSIAQQDYLEIEIANYGSPTAEEKKELGRLVKNKTIFDCLIVCTLSGINFVAKVIAVDYESKCIGIYDAANGEMVTIDYTE